MAANRRATGSGGGGVEGSHLAPPSSRWPFRSIAVVLGVTAFGAGLPTPLYPIYENQLHFSAGTLGLVFAAYTVGVFVTLFFFAPISDYIGCKPVLYVGMLLTVLSGLLFLSATSVATLALARVGSGLAVGATTSTATAAMAGLEPRGDQHHVARVAVAANFGAVAAGVLLSGLFAEYGPEPTKSVFYVLIAASLVGLAFVAMTPETIARAPGPRSFRVPRISVPRDLRSPFWVSTGALAACYSLYGLFGAMAPSLIRVDLAIGNYALAAGFVATMFGSAAFVQLVLGQVRDRRALLVGLPILLAGLAVFVTSDLIRSAPVLVLGAAVLGIGVGLAYMGSVTLIDRISPAGRRPEILSGFYLGGYLALAVPTIGVAESAEFLGLGTAGLLFGASLGVVVGGLFLVLRHTPTPAGGEGRARAPP